MLPNQAIASTPSAPRPSGAEGRGSTAPLCLQLLRTYVSMHKILSNTPRNHPAPPPTTPNIIRHKTQQLGLQVPSCNQVGGFKPSRTVHDATTLSNDYRGLAMLPTIGVTIGVTHSVPAAGTIEVTHCDTAPPRQWEYWRATQTAREPHKARRGVSTQQISDTSSRGRRVR
jgi:hypothetical protein